MDPVNWRQYHPVLVTFWSKQITAYGSPQPQQKQPQQPPQPQGVDPQSQQQQTVEEGYANWVNPQRLKSWN
jgi:hypothetical protein